MENALVELPVEAQEEIQAAKRVKNKKEVSATLAQEINAAYATYVSSNDEIFSLALTIENRRIALGTLLHTAKSAVGHGKFKAWLVENCKELSYRSVARFMEFAKVAGYKELDSIHNLTEYQKALTALGLREPNKGHGVQQLQDYNPFSVFTKTCMTAIQKINEVFEKAPLEDFDDDEKYQLKEQLEPLIKIYESL